jgi:medium-chain acyl-[acyl-carrier-protein] hydrolase
LWLQIIKRPEYNDELNVYTWSTSANKLFADRDFKVLDNNGETIIIATSRWIYMDINKRRPVRITAEIMDRYESEPERRVFSEEITKNEIPDTEYKEISYNILRRDVDYLGHMHNISYLDAAYEIMPEEYFNGPQYN